MIPTIPMTPRARKFLLALIAAALLGVAPGTSAFAALPVSSEISPVALDGFAWMASTQDAKLSFLLGVESAVAVEYAVAEAQAQKDNKQPLHSRFQTGWREAMTNQTRHELVRKLDAYYTAYPNEKARNIFAVIWTEIFRYEMPKGANQ